MYLIIGLHFGIKKKRAHQGRRAGVRVPPGSILPYLELKQYAFALLTEEVKLRFPEPELARYKVGPKLFEVSS